MVTRYFIYLPIFNLIKKIFFLLLNILKVLWAKNQDPLYGPL